MLTIAIIGSSGSHNRMHMFSDETVSNMVNIVENLILEEYNFDEIELWSGGSSGADHVAIILALKHKCKLRLFLPCAFESSKFHDTGNYNYKYNCGKLLNNLHKDFSSQTNIDSLKEIGEIIQRDNVHVTTHNGFLDRNRCVAKADCVIAFTQSKGNSPNDGGTLYTWNQSRSECKIHYTI